MKFSKYIVLFLLAVLQFSTLYAAPPNPQSNNILSISDAYFNYRGVRYSMKSALSDEFDIDLGCRIDTGAVDIVFVIDSTGSMSEVIDNVKANIDAFAAELDARGYDYRFGGITFGDGTNTWDFDYGTPGYQMTSSYSSFRTKLFNVSALGGWDVPEQSLDALEAAINNYSWRADAAQVIIFFTDACFCQIGECGGDCASSYNQSTVYSDIASSGCVLFASTSNPVYCDPCASIGSSGATNWYQNAAAATGGQWYGISAPWSTIFNDVIALIDTFEVVNFCVTNNSGVVIDPATATIIPGGCISILSDNPQTYAPWSPGEEHCFVWRINVTPGCTGSDACFDAIISGSGYADTITGCVFLEDCNCPGPTAEALCPPGCDDATSYTACTDQNIQITITDDDADVAPSSIQLMVDGMPFYYPYQMTFDDNVLTWTPLSSWSHGQTVHYQLIHVEDSNGCPSGTEIDCSFTVDLRAPEIVDYTPASGTELFDTILSATAEITDDLAGIDEINLHYTINGAEFELSSPYVYYYGDDENGTLIVNGTFSQLGISGADTIDICVYVQDRVPVSGDGCDLCGPNSDSLCWTVYAHLEGPVAQIISPQPGQITSCDDQCASIQITDDDGVDASTIRLAIFSATINDTFTIADPQLLWSNDTLRFCPDYGGTFWQNNETVNIFLLEADDIYGNSLTEPLYWAFSVDIEPPTVINFSPPCENVFHTPSPTISFDVSDNLSGFDETSLEVVFDGSDILYYSSPAISIAGSHITINTAIAGLAWSGGDTISMCVNLSDSPDICAPNDTTYCCEYYIATGGPAADIIRPFDGAWSSCTDEYVSFSLHDTEGVDASTVLFTVDRSSSGMATLSIGSPGVSLIGDSTNYVVEYRPPSAFADGETVDVCITSCDDILGNPLDSALCWNFYMDISPPILTYVSPHDGEIISDHTPKISFSLDDVGSGVNNSSISLTVDGSPYSTYEVGDTFFWDADSFGVEFDGGDTIEYCIHAEDDIDYCEDNALDTCIAFVIQPGPSIDDVWFYEETDCDGQNILFICYTLSGDTADISIRCSSDGGASWDVPLFAISDTAGDFGEDILPGTHCFQWLLSDDLPDYESGNFAVEVVASIVDSIVSTDVAYGAADSRNPDVTLSCPSSISAGEMGTFVWSIYDMFPASTAPCSLRIVGCGIDETYLVSGTFFSWTAPSVECQCTLYIAARDSFCNWGHDTCDFFIDVPPAIDSVWFSEETDCDSQNIVQICYILSGDSADISVQMSADGGISWDVPITTLSDTAGDIGEGVPPGIHCFDWNLGADLSDVEGCGFLVLVTGNSISGTISDTSAIGCLDSRPPNVMLDCPDEYLFNVGDTVYLDWVIDDSFPSGEPYILDAKWCSGETTIVIEGSNYSWVLPWGTICCDTVWLSIAAKDSFCNFGNDSCFILKIPGGTVTFDTSICLGDTLTLCCTTYVEQPLSASNNHRNRRIDRNELKTAIDYTDTCCFDFIPLTPGEDLICHTVFDTLEGCEYEECWHLTTCCRPEGIITQSIVSVDSIYGTYTTLFELEFDMFDSDSCEPCCNYDELHWFIEASSDTNWLPGPLAGYDNDTIIYISVACEESIEVCVDAVNLCSDIVPCVAETCIVLYGDSCHPCCDISVEPSDTIVCETDPEITICAHINNLCSSWDDYDTIWWEIGTSDSIIGDSLWRTQEFSLDDTCITISAEGTTFACIYGIADNDTCADCATVVVQYLPDTLRDTTVYLGQILIVYYPGSDSSVLFTHLSDSVGTFRLCYTVDVPPCEPYEDCMIVDVIPPDVCCPLHSGWNQIGFNIEPDDTILENALFSIWDNLEQAIGENGTYIRDVYNDLYGVHGGSGYWVRLSAPDDLNIVGSLIPPDTPIPLSAGWHSIAYLLDGPLPPEDALASITGKFDQVWGEEGVWIAGGFGDLEFMRQCKGYDIHITEPCTLDYSLHTGNWDEENLYDNLYDEECNCQSAAILDTTVGPYTYVRTPNSCFYFGSATLDGALIQAGDVVAVFRDDICCGAKVVSADDGTYSVRAYGAVSPDPGFHYGEIPEFRIWRAADDTEFVATPLADSSEIYWENLTYRNVDIVAPAAIAEFKRPDKISLNVIPNPFNSSLSIEYYLPAPGYIKISIYDIEGHRVTMLLNKHQSEGNHSTKWLPNDETPSGVYFVKLTFGDNVIIKRAMLAR